MKALLSKLPLALCTLIALNAPATTRYVDVNNPSPTPPYTNWTTAATNIQDAINVAAAGDLLLATNGTYNRGGLALAMDIYNFAPMTNRIALTKPVILRSVNGPSVTFIEGYQVPSLTNAAGAVRCAYVTNGAVLSGFTLTKGATLAGHIGADAVTFLSGGGAWCVSTNATITNCVIFGNSAYSMGAGAYSGTILNSAISNCSAGVFGGGACSNLLINSVLVANDATSGGGAMGATLNGCVMMWNAATNGSSKTGGGAAYSYLYNCVVSNCTAGAGGGIIYSIARSCSLSSNRAYVDGGGARNSMLNDCDIRTNTTMHNGGGVSYCSLSNCFIFANSAGYGGGAADSFVTNSIFAYNRANSYGGGIWAMFSVGCLVVSNTAFRGGGVSGGNCINSTIIGNSASYSGGAATPQVIRNCIIWDNTSPSDANYELIAGQHIEYCCTFPMPTIGVGNITNTPLFVDSVGGNFQLQTNSPCINSGNNTPVSIEADLAGNPRVVGGTVDIGAYEFQSPASMLSYAWAQQYGLPTDGTVDTADPDGDGANNWQEWRADTIPTNSLSVLRMVSATNSPTGAQVTWQSVSTRSYWLECATNLGDASPFQTVATNILGAAGTMTVTDPGATNAGPYFYRVGVQ